MVRMMMVAGRQERLWTVRLFLKPLQLLQFQRPHHFLFGGQVVAFEAAVQVVGARLSEG